MGMLGMDNILSNGAIRLGGSPAVKALHRLVLLVVTILFGLIPDQLRAADISINLTQAEKDMGCFSVLRGVISAGDVERVEDFLGQSRPSQYPQDGFGYRICLDSPGGSLLEAVRLVDVIFGHGTAVASDGVCESACAILFMSGSFMIPGIEGFTPDRLMHPQASIGFHAPALVVPDGLYNETTVKEAYDNALQTIALISELWAAAEPLLRNAPSLDLNQALFDVFLTTPSESFAYVETVSDAVLFDINLYPFDNFYSDPRAALNSLCEFERAIEYNQRPSEIWEGERDNDFVIVKETGSPRSVIYRSVEGNYTAVSDQLKCYVQVFRDMKPARVRVGHNLEDATDETESLREMYPMATYPRNTVLSEINNGLSVSEFIALAARKFSQASSQNNEEPSWQQIFSDNSVIHLGDENIRDWPTLHGRCYDLMLPKSEGATQLAITFEPYGLERVTVYSAEGNFPVGSQEIMSGTRPNYWGQRIDIVLPVSAWVASYAVRICSETLDARDYDDLLLRNIKGWAYR